MNIKKFGLPAAILAAILGYPVFVSFADNNLFPDDNKEYIDSLATVSEYYLEEETKTMVLPYCDRDGYTLVEWNSEADGTGVSYQPGDEYEFCEDITLYAIWLRTATDSEAIEEEATSSEAKLTVSSPGDIIELIAAGYSEEDFVYVYSPDTADDYEDADMDDDEEDEDGKDEDVIDEATSSEAVRNEKEIITSTSSNTSSNSSSNNSYKYASDVYYNTRRSSAGAKDDAEDDEATPSEAS